jgi:hypothetical protein
MSPRPPLLLACALVGCAAALLLQFTSPLLAVEAVSAAATPTPGAVVVNPDGTMTVDGAPFKIKGVGQLRLSVQEGDSGGMASVSCGAHARSLCWTRVLCRVALSSVFSRAHP